MTGQIALDEERENGFMSLFNNSQRRCRRKGLSNIFEGLEEEERISFQNRLMISSSPSSTIDENGEVITCTAMDTTPAVTPDSNCCHPRKDAADHSDESDRLSGLIEEESSSPSVSMETARPSCLVGLKSSSSNSTSSSSTSPSSMSSQTSSSSSASYFSSSSFSGESKMQACSPDDSTTTRGFTASPSSSTSSMCYITFSRVRRNALHDLFETLTQDDLEKLKNLYQTAVTTAYSLKPFSEQTQSPIRGFHEYVKKLAEELNIGEPTMKLIVDGLLQPINYDLRDKYEKPLFRTEITSLKDLTNGQKLSGRVSNVTHFGAFVDIGVGIDGLVHVSQMNPDVLRQNNRTKLELGDRIEVMVLSLDIQKSRIGLSLCKFL